ncbi:YheC/YheD family protein [Melghirimyces algeriensis]|uniref:YheC/D like ATP-grasp n=1 Tax=Melghirimyces algeriensis TaxID=910412 RepID=A0A521CU14_9BACL|nr:YheC/YheD family protein [Melghirimyces algeriensis]SMO62902.1 YheC/D like ATP-grasp [Melghirimyces algeriensis]
MKYKKSKWKQADLLKRNHVTAKALPETLFYNIQNLKDMLKRHPFVYIKPDTGGQGRGIFRVTRKLTKEYHIQGNHYSQMCTDVNSVHQCLEILIQAQNYIIQQGIQSETSDGRPFDFRVHVQRVRGRWVIGGIVGRLGSPSNIVTNRHQGGRPLRIKQLFRKYLAWNRKKEKRVIERIKRLAMETAKAMNKGYPECLEQGVDIGVDAKGRPWIFESNITPGIAVFAALKDKKAYWKIRKNRRLQRKDKEIAMSRYMFTFFLYVSSSCWLLDLVDRFF